MITLITNIGKLLTMEPGKGREGELGIIRDAAIIIEDGKIKWIGPDCRRGAPLRAPELGGDRAPPLHAWRGGFINAKDAIVIPGLIDCHTHLVHAGSRANEFAMRARGATYKEIAKAGGGIMATVRSTRTASEKKLFDLAAERAKESISHGVTTMEVKSGYGLDLKTELKMLRVIKRLQKELPIDFVPTFLAHTVPKENSKFEIRNSKLNRTQYINSITHQLLPSIAKEKLAGFCDVFVEDIAFTKAEAREILKAAKKHGLKSKLHADQLTSSGGAGLAAETHAVSADHLEHIGKKDIKALAKADVVAVIIPSSTFFIGGKYAPARKLINAGVKVAIATDYNPGTSPILNLWLAAAMAITQMNLTPEEAYRAITINAAGALALDKTRGSIKVGKKADLVFLDAESEFDPFYRFDRSFVTKVMKEGKFIKNILV